MGRVTRGEAVRALLGTWTRELGDDASHGVLFGILVARADPALAGVVEQGLEEMLDEDRDIALANQGARERWCAGVRDWLSREGVAV